MKNFWNLITILALAVAMAALAVAMATPKEHRMEPISMGEAALPAIDDPRLATDTSEIFEISRIMSWGSGAEEVFWVNPEPVDVKYTLRAMGGNLIVEMSAEHPAITTVTAYGRQVWPEPQKKPEPPDFYTWPESPPSPYWEDDPENNRAIQK